MKTKQIPVLITLIAGLITCIISFVNQVSMDRFVKTLCLVVVVFFILGSVVSFILAKNFPLEENELNEAETETDQEHPEEQEQEEEQ